MESLFIISNHISNVKWFINKVLHYFKNNILSVLFTNILHNSVSFIQSTCISNILVVYLIYHCTNTCDIFTCQQIDMKCGGGSTGHSDNVDVGSWPMWPWSAAQSSS